MSFVPFFYAALRDGDSPSSEKAAEYVVAGHELAEAVQTGLSPKFARDKGMKEAVAYYFLEAATRESARALFHLAKYLASKGEFLGAGQLLDAQSRTDSSLTLAKARRQARTDAMRATKAIGTHKWKTAVRTAGERLRKAERGWPMTDVELARRIRKSKEVLALPKHLIPGESTVRGAIREYNLGAKARRNAIRKENQSRREALRKAPGLRRVASADC